MKHETVRIKVALKPKTEKSKAVIKSIKTNPAAKKTVDSKDLKVIKTNSVKKIESSQKNSTTRLSTRNTTKKAEKTVSQISAKTVKAPNIKTIVSIKKAKLAVIKTEPKIAKREAKITAANIIPKISLKEVDLKIKKSEVISPIKNVRSAPKKLKTIVSATISKPTPEIKKVPKRNAPPATKIASGGKEVLSIAAAKINLQTSVKPIQVPKIEVVAVKKTKLAEAKVADVNLPTPKPPKKKKIKPISSAVFRGKKEKYSFEVFSLTEEFESIPAVFVISRRKTDRLKKAHHSLVCIGQTNSIFDELKKHRKGKCVKKYGANVVSILPVASEKTRLRIENDLKAAHSVVCSFE